MWKGIKVIISQVLLRNSEICVQSQAIAVIFKYKYAQPNISVNQLTQLLKSYKTVGHTIPKYVYT